MTTQYNQLIIRLDNFIRKYYKNKILKGVLISATLYLFIFLTTVSLEYFFRFGTAVRAIIFYTALLSYILIFAEFILLPVLKLLNIGKVISYSQASGIISNYFSDVKDKLLNILELANSNNTQTNSLLLASIDQKIETIRPFNFSEVINYKKSLNFFKYLVVPLVLFLYLSFFQPQIISSGTERIVNYSTYYEQEMPFEFVLLNDSLQVRKGDDFKLKLKIKGDYLPSQVAVNYNDNEFLLSKKDNFSKSEFVYTFKNVNNNFDFQLVADGYKSRRFSLSVLPNPLVLKFYAEIIPPAYTGVQPQKYSNTGDFTVPFGSKVVWKFTTKDINSLSIKLSDTLTVNSENKKDNFTAQAQFFNSQTYDIIVSNDFFKNEKLLTYKVLVQPDLYPEIEVSKLRDTTKLSQYYFAGATSDDYGFNSLTFNYATFEEGQGNLKYKKIAIPIQKNATAQEFYYFFDFADLEINSGETVKYFFEVRDNDAISGYKATRSQMFEYSQLSLKEVDSLNAETNKSIQEKVNKASELSNKIQKDLNEFKERNLNEKMSEWEKTNFIDQLLQKQEDLDNLINDIKQENQEKNNRNEAFTEQKEEAKKKQEEIQKLLDELLTDELKELLEKLRELQEQFNEKKFDKTIEQMEYNYEELNNQLDKDLELLKQFEVEEKINNTIEQLNELSEKQEKLSEKSKDKNADKEEISKEQKKIEEEFEQLMEEYDDAQEKNNELENPMKLDDFEQEKNEIEQDMQQSQEMLQKGKMKKSSKSQQKSAQDMKKMAESMESMMSSNTMQQNAESIEDLRQIITNLTDFSFSQENLYTQMQDLYTNSPKFRDLKVKQLELESDFKVVEDSLFALSKRNPQINQPVSDEISQIKMNLDKALENMEKRSKSKASINQRNVMTSANNLALLLNEILDQMQQQSGGGGGGGSCQKPGGGKPSMSDMKGQQQKLKQQLEQMLEEMKNGQNCEGIGSDGENGKNGKNGKKHSKGLAQQLAEQEMFEQMLQEIMNGNQYKPETMQELNEIKKINEEIKQDILQDNITPETLERQNEIMTRLLEAEESENEREFEKKRESNEAKNIKKKNPNEIKEKFKQKNSYSETLNKNSLKLQNFYKQQYDSYLKNLNN